MDGWGAGITWLVVERQKTNHEKNNNDDDDIAPSCRTSSAMSPALTFKTPLKFPQNVFGRHRDPSQPTPPAATCLPALSSPFTFNPVLPETRRFIARAHLQHVPAQRTSANPNRFTGNKGHGISFKRQLPNKTLKTKK